MFVALGETTDLIEVIRTPKFTWGNQVVNNPKGKEGNHMGSRMDIISDGQAAQEKFLSIMLDGFSQEEIDSMKQYNDQILRNISACLKGKETE